MPYVTGVVNNVTDLRTLINNTCVANGYTLTGEVLSKGTFFVRTWITTDYLNLQGQTGASSGIAPSLVRFTAAGLYPLTVHIFIFDSPDEVYVVAHDTVGNHRWVAFGQSPVPGLPGTGNWYGGVTGPGQSAAVNSMFNSNGSGSPSSGGGTSGALFWQTVSAFAPQNGAFFHHGIAGVGTADGWSTSVQGTTTYTTAVFPVSVKLSYLPNAWNNENVLVRILPHIAQSDNKVSMIGQLAHARYLRITNINPGEVITLGSDRWKVFPFLKKDSANPTGGVANASGTYGWAIRYDGP